MPGRGLGLFLESREVAWSGVAGSRLKGWDQCQGPLKRPPSPSCQSGMCPDAGQPSEREAGMQDEVEGNGRGSDSLGPREVGPQRKGGSGAADTGLPWCMGLSSERGNIPVQCLAQP